MIMKSSGHAAHRVLRGLSPTLRVEWLALVPPWPWDRVHVTRSTHQGGAPPFHAGGVLRVRDPAAAGTPSHNEAETAAIDSLRTHALSGRANFHAPTQPDAL